MSSKTEPVRQVSRFFPDPCDAVPRTAQQRSFSPRSLTGSNPARHVLGLPKTAWAAYAAHEVILLRTKAETLIAISVSTGLWGASQSSKKEKGMSLPRQRTPSRKAHLGLMLQVLVGRSESNSSEQRCQLICSSPSSSCGDTDCRAVTSSEDREE